MVEDRWQDVDGVYKPQGALKQVDLPWILVT